MTTHVDWVHSSRVTFFDAGQFFPVRVVVPLTMMLLGRATICGDGAVVLAEADETSRASVRIPPATTATAKTMARGRDMVLLRWSSVSINVQQPLLRYSPVHQCPRGRSQAPKFRFAVGPPSDLLEKSDPQRSNRPPVEIVAIQGVLN